MAAEMNTTRTNTNNPSSTIFRREPATFGKAEWIAGLQSAAVAGYTMGMMALVVSWIHSWGTWLPFNDVAGTLIPAFANLDGGFNIFAVIIGILIHFTISLVLGLLFAALYSRVIRLNSESGMPVVAGLIFGTVTWLLARYGILPTLGTEVYARPAFLIAHMVFGATLGVLYPMLVAHNHKHHPSWS